MGEHIVQFYEDETILTERVRNRVVTALRDGHASIDGRPDKELFRKPISPIIKRMRHDSLRNIYIYGEMAAMFCDRGERDAAIRPERMHKVGADGRVIRACPAELSGSASTIKLPLPPHHQHHAPNSEPFLEQQGSRRSANVLIVDDNIDAADSLAEFLKALGHTIHVAYDGRSAIDAASRVRPETVILDIGMPDMSGYQVAQLLRSEIGLTSSTLIAVSGYAQESDRMAARAAGFDHHFAKPLDIRRLTALLSQSG